MTKKVMVSDLSETWCVSSSRSKYEVHQVSGDSETITFLVIFGLWLQRIILLMSKYKSDCNV